MLSTRELIRMRESLLQITAGEWLWLGLGLVLGGTAWIVFNRKVVRRWGDRLKYAGLGENPRALAEGTVGLAVMALNFALLYFGDPALNFFLLGFALTGLLVGAWILIPGNFE